MPYSEETARQDLIKLLQTKKGILFAGAGASCSAGYPLWGDLLAKLKAEFTPKLNPPASSKPLQVADLIKKEQAAKGQAGLDAYHNFLGREFAPKAIDQNFHLPLVQLGFCGIVTTNYERLLEAAAIQAYSTQTNPYSCQELDLRTVYPTEIFKFLRNLAHTERPASVLHLHGYYNRPDMIVLSEEDYRRVYGEIELFDSEGNPTSGFMDPLPRRVLWSLLVMHSLVFVGFSLSDPAMTEVLRFIQTELHLGYDRAHFALMGYVDDADKERQTGYLIERNITPVFYQVKQAPDLPPDHGNLTTLVRELAQAAGTPLGAGPSVLDISRNTLER